MRQAEVEVAKRPMTILLVLLGLTVCLLALAWYDGGREEQRLIVQEVDLPELPRGEGA